MKAIEARRKRDLTMNDFTQPKLTKNLNNKRFGFFSDIFDLCRKKIFTNDYGKTIDILQEDDSTASTEIFSPLEQINIPKNINFEDFNKKEKIFEPNVLSKIEVMQENKLFKVLPSLSEERKGSSKVHPTQETKVSSPLKYVPKCQYEPKFKVLESKGSLEIRQLLIDQNYHKINSDIDKTIIFIGETGSGKTTLINAISNFLLDVQFADAFRYKLIIEEGFSQAHSQTSEVTSYSIYSHLYGCQVKLIDTPGFGDMRGLQDEKYNKRRINELLISEDKIDAVCFVCKANQNRITETQKYILEEALEIFAHDVAKNFFLMLTFADGGEPVIIETLRQEGYIFQKSFTFNNRSLFVENTSPNQRSFLEYWICKNFFCDLCNITSVSLNLTKVVVRQRERISALTKNLVLEINDGRIKMDEIKEIIKKKNLCQSQINQTRSYKSTDLIKKVRTIPCAPGQITNYCPKCHYTCHERCSIKEIEQGKCKRMDEFKNCTACPQKCFANIHFRSSKIIQYYEDQPEVMKEMKNF